jgi:hypothetical protein
MDRPLIAMDKVDLLFNDFKITAFFPTFIDEINSTMHCASPPAPTPIHCNDCFRVREISPDATGLMGHFSNLGGYCFLSRVKVGFG